jgi:cytochrome c1
LQDLTEKVTAKWISDFIHDPKKTIDGGDERAKMLFDKYHTVMPSFAALGDEKLNDIIAFMNTVKVFSGKTRLRLNLFKGSDHRKNKNV